MNEHDIAGQVAKLAEWERRVVHHWLEHRKITRSSNELFQEQITIGQRVADSVASFGGSWTFIILFLAGMLGWILFNLEAARRFDPFPFILLNLVLSCMAALQAPVIMMSQNRQAVKDRLDAQQDFEINLKAEMEVMALHEKLDRQMAKMEEMAAELRRLREKP